ncbi:MAG: F0F1 ATP synthase subunit B [Patescibacteria group bacterium]
MEIFENFGIDIYLVAAQIVNFLVILYILRRFLYKPLFKIFKQREALAESSIKNAQETKKILEKTQTEEKEILKKAQVAANQLLKDAKDQAAELIEKTEVAAKKRTDKMIQEARLQIAQETKEAEVRLSKHVAQLSVAMLKQSLTTIFSEKEQESIVQRAVKNIEKQSN